MSHQSLLYSPTLLLLNKESLRSYSIIHWIIYISLRSITFLTQIFLFYCFQDVVEIMKESLYDKYVDEHGFVDFARSGGMSQQKEAKRFLNALNKQSELQQKDCFSISVITFLIWVYPAMSCFNKFRMAIAICVVLNQICMVPTLLLSVFQVHTRWASQTESDQWRLKKVDSAGRMPGRVNSGVFQLLTKSKGQTSIKYTYIIYFSINFSQVMDKP